MIQTIVSSILLALSFAGFIFACFYFLYMINSLLNVLLDMFFVLTATSEMKNLINVEQSIAGKLTTASQQHLKIVEQYFVSAQDGTLVVQSYLKSFLIALSCSVFLFFIGMIVR